MDLLVIVLILLLILAIIGIVIYLNIKRKISNFSRQVFGTGDIIQAIKENEQRIQSTPKSVSGGDSMFINQIKDDFPEFNLNNAKNDISIVLKDVYMKSNNSFSSKYPDIFLQLENLNKESIKSIKIHKTVISNYEKSYNDACIKFQSAYELVFNNGEKNQFRAELDYSFSLNSNESLKCPHCGAPVSKFGIKKCEFCGHGIIYDVDETWAVTKIKNL